MRLQNLLEDLVKHGVTVVLKVDEERYAEKGEYWTLIMSGAALGAGGYIRTEESSLEQCLNLGLAELKARDRKWDWVSAYLEELIEGLDEGKVS